MKSWLKTLIVLSALLVLPSCATTEKLLNSRGYIKAESITPPVCAGGAFIDEKYYELTAPVDDSEKAFKAFVIDMATKYPSLKLSYHQLRECFESVHGKQKDAVQ